MRQLAVSLAVVVTLGFFSGAQAQEKPGEWLRQRVALLRVRAEVNEFYYGRSSNCPVNVASTWLASSTST